jgi:methylmalonyl-CoA mutase C-terminal domain/subunit
MQLIPPVVEMLREQESSDIIVLIGGIIPRDDIVYLKEHGVAEVFTPGSSTVDIVNFIKNKLELN